MTAIAPPWVMLTVRARHGVGEVHARPPYSLATSLHVRCGAMRRDLTLAPSLASSDHRHDGRIVATVEWRANQRLRCGLFGETEVECLGDREPVVVGTLACSHATEPDGSFVVLQDILRDVQELELHVVHSIRSRQSQE